MKMAERLFVRSFLTLSILAFTWMPVSVAQPAQEAILQQRTAVFVGSQKSNRFHTPSCRYVKRIGRENRVSFSSESNARESGYVPCKVCKP